MWPLLTGWVTNEHLLTSLLMTLKTTSCNKNNPCGFYPFPTKRLKKVPWLGQHCSCFSIGIPPCLDHCFSPFFNKSTFALLALCFLILLGQVWNNEHGSQWLGASWMSFDHLAHQFLNLNSPRAKKVTSLSKTPMPMWTALPFPFLFVWSLAVDWAL